MKITKESWRSIPDRPKWWHERRYFRGRFIQGRRDDDKLRDAIKSAIKAIEGAEKKCRYLDESPSDVVEHLSEALSDLSDAEELCQSITDTAEAFEQWGDEWSSIAVSYWQDTDPDDYWIFQGFMNAQQLPWDKRLTPEDAMVRKVQLQLMRANG